MLRAFFTNKWILGSFGFFVIFAGLCYLWYQHTTAPYRENTAELDWIRRQSEKQRIASTATSDKTTEQSEDATVESTRGTAEKSINKPKHVTDSEAAAENAEVAEVRVSKFGFGPYPELPADFPHQDMFDPPYYADDPNHPYKDNPNYELMDRLWVELWKRGKNVEGFGTLKSTGLFYPTIRGTIYVEWAPRWKVFDLKIGRKIRYIDGHPDDLKRLTDANTESDIPSDIKVLDISEGIDPYEFLDLPRK